MRERADLAVPSAYAMNDRRCVGCVLVLALLQGCGSDNADLGGPDCRSLADETYLMHGTGVGFDSFEGRTIVVVTSTETTASTCMTSTQVVVSNGQFAVEVTNAWDGTSVYPSFGAYVDEDANGECDDGEPAWTSVTTLVQGVCTGELRGDTDTGRCADL